MDTQKITELQLVLREALGIRPSFELDRELDSMSSTFATTLADEVINKLEITPEHIERTVAALEEIAESLKNLNYK